MKTGYEQISLYLVIFFKHFLWQSKHTKLFFPSSVGSMDLVRDMDSDSEILMHYNNLKRPNTYNCESLEPEMYNN